MPAGCTGTSGWSATACRSRGRYPGGLPEDESATILPCTPRITRWTTPRSRARSRRPGNDLGQRNLRVRKWAEREVRSCSTASAPMDATFYSRRTARSTQVVATPAVSRPKTIQQPTATPATDRGYVRERSISSKTSLPTLRERPSKTASPAGREYELHGSPALDDFIAQQRGDNLRHFLP